MATTTKRLGIVPINRGTYNANEDYYMDNIVQLNNCSYYCKVDGPVRGVEPGTENVKWGLWSGSPIVQELGNSEDKVISQKVLTDILNEQTNNIEILSNNSYQKRYSTSKSAGDFIPIQSTIIGESVTISLIANETNTAVNVYLLVDTSLAPGSFLQVFSSKEVGNSKITTIDKNYNYIRITSSQESGYKEIDFKTGVLSENSKNISEIITTLDKSTSNINNNTNNIDDIKNILGTSETYTYSTTANAGPIEPIPKVSIGTKLTVTYVANETGTNAIIYLLTDTSLNSGTYKAILNTVNPGSSIDFIVDKEYKYIRLTSGSTPGYKEVNLSIHSEGGLISITNKNLEDIKECKQLISNIASASQFPIYYDFVNILDTDFGIFSNGFSKNNLSSEGYVSHGGVNNFVKINTSSCADQFKFVAEINIKTTSTKAVLGSISKNSEKFATLGIFDFENKTMSINGNTTGLQMDSLATLSKNINSIVTSDCNSYIIEIGKDNRTKYITIENTKTGQLEKLEALGDYRNYGFLYDYLSFGSMGNGDIIYKKIYGIVPKDVFAIFMGDSITQGASYSDYSLCWAKKAADYLGNSYVFARHGGNIDDIIRTFDTIAKFCNPKYVIVTIGTNGGNTLQKWNELISKINSIGAIPIINRLYLTNESSRKDRIQEYNNDISKLGVLGARFDVATALNNDISQGANNSLFQGDLLHPNIDGYNIIYQRFISDVGRFIKL